jgi:hypothetical protein
MRKKQIWRDKYGQLWKSTWWETNGKKQYFYKKMKVDGK